MASVGTIDQETLPFVLCGVREVLLLMVAAVGLAVGVPSRWLRVYLDALDIIVEV